MVQNPPSSLNYLNTKGKWYVYVTIPPELRPAFKDQTQLRRSTGTSDKTIAKTRQHGIAAEIYAELDKARTELNPARDALEALSDAVGAGKPTYFPEAYKDREALAAMLDQARGIVAAVRYRPTYGDQVELAYREHDLTRAEPLLERVHPVCRPIPSSALAPHARRLQIHNGGCAVLRVPQILREFPI